MEITFKFIIDKVHPKKDLTCPVRVRFYQDRNYKEYSLGFAIPNYDWDEKLQQVYQSNPSHLSYNTKISCIKTKVQKYLLFNEDKGILVEELIKHISGNKEKDLVKVKPDILSYGKEVINKLQERGDIGNSIVYSCAINKLASYVNKKNLLFESINYKFLENFQDYMLINEIKINSISNYLRTIRALFNRAIADGTLEAKYYPFRHFKIKNEETISRTLTGLEMAQIVSLNLPIESSIWHQRNLFILSYCFRGMNLADLLTLTKENLVDNTIVFRRKKTHKIYKIKIDEKAKTILGYYSTSLPKNNNQFILPFVIQKNNLIQLKKDITQAIKNCNNALLKIAKQCDINKGVTSYFARYSWANIAKSLGYSKDMIAEGLGHQYGHKTTSIYLDNYDDDTINTMNEKVIKTVFVE